MHSRQRPLSSNVSPYEMAASVRRTVDPQLFARDPYAFYLIALEILRSADPRDLSPAQRHHYAIDFCIESVRKGGLEQFFQAASPAQVETTTDRKSTRLNSSHQIISYA